MSSSNNNIFNTTLEGNATEPRHIPSWLPAGFDVAHDDAHCLTPRQQLTSFAIWNCIAIASFLLLGNTLTSITKWLTKNSRARSIAHDKWSFWSASVTLSLQLGGIFLTAWLIQSSGYRASFWDLVQLWTLRPRIAWFTGQFARSNRRWGYVNGALSNIFAEVFVCGLATAFLGRTLQAAFSVFNNSTPKAMLEWTWYMIVISSLAMLLSTGFEMLWALLMLKRFIEHRGRAEAQDMDSMLWITKIVVPVTAVSSWLIWIAFLHASQGAYCPGNIKWTNLIWSVSPVLANTLRPLIEYCVN